MPDRDPVSVRVERVAWLDQEPVLANIRRRVFIEEQSVPENDEWDPADSEATHFLASTPDGQPVGCARLLPCGKIGRMAVLADFRQHGIGTSLLRTLIDHGRQHNITHNLYLDAQVHAIGFYERAGFVAEGEPFEDAGILHRRMRLAAQPSTFSQSHTRATDSQPAEPSEEAVIRLSGASDVLNAMRVCLEQGRYSVDVLSDWLCPAIYSDQQLVSGISALARNHRRAQVRILVRDTRPLAGTAHGLVELAQRLPSRVAVRALRDDAQQSIDSFFLVDKSALVQLANERELVGFVRRQARPEARRLLETFDYLWEQHGATDPNLRSFVL